MLQLILNKYFGKLFDVEFLIKAYLRITLHGSPIYTTKKNEKKLIFLWEEGAKIV